MPPKQKEEDPLGMSGLEPAAIEAAVESKKTKTKPPPTELEVQKESRLAAKEKRLADKPNSAPPGPDPYLPPVVELDKSALLDKLGAYKERFPHLKKRNNVSIKSSADDILDELHYYEMQLGSKQDGSFGAMILHGTMLAVETIHRDVWNPMGLNLNGLARVTKDNMSEFQPIVDELMIKYGGSMYMSPEMRLTLALGALVMTVHGANSGDPRIASALEKMNAEVKVPKSAADL